MLTPRLILILFVISLSVSAQVEIIKEGKTYSRYADDFVFIDSQTDTIQLVFVARIKASEKENKNTLQTLFLQIQNKATKLGATSFKVYSFQRNPTTTEALLILDVYFASQDLLLSNEANYTKNVVYVFGGEQPSQDEFSCKVDNQKMVFKSGTYLKLPLQQGKELKVSKGGITGAAAWFNWKEEKPAIFLSISGIGLAGGGVSPNGGVGVAFTTGSLNKIDSNLGYLYTPNLKTSKLKNA